MVLRIKNDYGTLSCYFDGMCVWFCDNLSNECYVHLEKRMTSLYGEGFQLDYIYIDTDKMDVKIFKVSLDDEVFVLPFLTVAWHVFFRYGPGCDLLKFVNLFARKRLEFINGRASYSMNRNYLRLHK